MKKTDIKLIVIALGLVLTITACSNDQVIKRSSDWAEIHPDEYQSYLANEEMSQTTYGGSVPIDYLEEFPELKVYYDGYGFSKEYKRARGHTYALDDVINTVRPKPGASCLSCKTADFAVALENEGIEEISSMDFDEFVESHPEMETISCYDCHRNNPGEVHVTRHHIGNGIDRLPEELEVPDQTMACAQCHVEYYLNPDTKEVTLPYDYGLDTTGMLQYYDEKDFADWEHPGTGADMLKAQHPEFETYTGSVHQSAGMTCIDCHMPVKESSQGSNNIQASINSPKILVDGELAFRSHHWTSPLKDKAAMENTCISCHSDSTVDELIGRVEEVQGQVLDRQNQVSEKLLAFVEGLTAAREAGVLSEEDLARLQEIHRHAQFKWDIVFVENSEGFHNSEKAMENFDQAEVLVDEGLEILQGYGY